MKKPDFIICGPFAMADKSHGVRTLVEMARAIERSGRRAFLYTYGFINGQETFFQVNFDKIEVQNEMEDNFFGSIFKLKRDFGVKFLTDFSPEYLANSYAIYPEVMRNSNVLKSRNVIRYFLNKDGELSGHKVESGSNDFILSFSESMHPNPHHICFYVGDDYEMFDSRNALATGERRIDVTYIGKGKHYGLSGVMPNTVEITRKWPKTKEQLAILLRNCRFFYTGDACSKINVEALGCGAVPVYLHNGTWTEEEIDSGEFGVIPRLRPNTTIGSDFFTNFETRRSEFMNRLQTLIDGWDPSVQQMIEKVDRHFSGC